jgi:hypothetical protein
VEETFKKGEEEGVEEIKLHCFFMGINASAERPIDPFLLLGLEHRNLWNGQIEYLKYGKPLIRDTGPKVFVLDESPEAIEAGLRLALLKFGKGLHACGSKNFLEAIARFAGDNRIVVEFDDAQVQGRYEYWLNKNVQEESPNLENIPNVENTTIINRKIKAQVNRPGFTGDRII